MTSTPAATQHVTLTKKSTWRGQTKYWSNTYHFSGTGLTTVADARTLAAAVFSGVEAPFIQPAEAVLYSYSYYDGHTSIALADEIYGQGTLGAAPAATGTAYGAGQGTVNTASALDLAVMVYAQCGKSSTGKKVYLRKWFHGSGQYGNAALVLSTAGQTALSKLTDGSLPNAVVTTNPAGTASGAWAMSPYIRTHQLTRGYAKKKS